MTINLNSKSVLILRRLIYWGGGVISRFFLLKPSLVILCYHGVSSDGWRFSTPIADFKKHISYLIQHFTIVSLDDVYLHLSGKKKLTSPSVSITFDDGYQDLVDLVPYFRKLKIRPAVFALSKPHAVDRAEIGNSKPLLTHQELNTLAKAGWVVGCHSSTHPDLSRLNSQQLAKETIHAKKGLEKIIGKPVKYFAYPKGRYTPNAVQKLKKSRYKMALSMDNAIAVPKATNLFSVPRIGIDASHSPDEFQDTLSPVNIYLRRKFSQLNPHYDIV